jgi:hypothetical protein
MKRRTPREIELADALLAIWEAASGAVAAQEHGHANYTVLADTLRAIAEDAAETLADLTIGCPLSEEA